MRNHKRGLPFVVLKTHLTGKFTDVFFIGYCCLLNIMQIAIIKVSTMIVNPINEYNNMYKIAIRVFSIISLTSFMEATTSACSHF